MTRSRLAPLALLAVTIGVGVSACGGQQQQQQQASPAKHVAAQFAIAGATASVADQVAAQLKATTISYPTWARNVSQGRYVNPSVTTAWGRAFALLATIQQPPPPTPTTTAATTTTTTTETVPPATTPVPPSPGSVVAPPLGPTSYPIPAGAVIVTNATQLAAALTGAAKDIVLADGTYDTPVTDSNGSRIYAQHLGKAVFTAGLVVGGNFSSGGAIVQGLAFNVSDAGKTFQGGALQAWGAAGADLHVYDCTFDGHGIVPVGLLAYNPDGLIAQRLTFAHFTDEGIRASDNFGVAYGAPTAVINAISDISVDGVSYPTPGGSNGTAEAGLFIGQPVANGVKRIRVRNVSISGIETANNSRDTTFSDLDIDMSGPYQSSAVGIYLEHYSVKDTFTNFLITGARAGFNAEWDNGVAGNSGAHNVTIQNGTIDAAGSTLAGHQAGVYLDAGTESTTVTNVIFKNQNWAGIAAYLNTGTNHYSGNTYQLDAGATQVSTSHI